MSTDTTTTTTEATNNTSKQKIEDLLAVVLTKQREVENCRKELKASQMLLSDTLKKLKQLIGKSSFEYGGKYYSIRTRSGNTFMCASDVPFGSWLKKSKGQIK